MDCLSCSEKSPSGPVIIHKGFLLFLFISIFLFLLFRSVNIKFIFFLLFLRKIFRFWGFSNKGGFILFDCSVASIVIERTSQAITVTIYTARPGIVIGRGGEEVSRLKKEVAKLCNTEDIHLNINEVKRPELNAELVGQNIASQLVKKMPYRRVLNKTMQSTMRMGAEGIRINVSGRLGGVEIARSERFMEGRVPLHTLRADIDYALVEAHTTYGIIGIKVWICNGFSKAKK